MITVPYSRAYLHEGDGGEVDAVSDVAHGIDAGHVGATELIHLDGSLVVHVHPDLPVKWTNQISQSNQTS